MKSFEIYFRDLNEEAQKNLLEEFETTEADENWETIALAIVEREDEEEDDAGSVLPDECLPQPEDEDYVLFDSGFLGSMVSAGVVKGKFLGEYKTEYEALSAIMEDMEASHFYPDIWYKDDHGGYRPATFQENLQGGA